STSPAAGSGNGRSTTWKSSGTGIPVGRRCSNTCRFPSGMSAPLEKTAGIMPQRRAGIAAVMRDQGAGSRGGCPACRRRKRRFSRRQLGLAKPADRDGYHDDKKDHHHDGGEKRPKLVRRRGGHGRTVTVS